MRYLIAAAVLDLSGAAIGETWAVDDDGTAHVGRGGDDASAYSHFNRC